MRQQQLDQISRAISQRQEQRCATVDLPMVDVGAVLQQLARCSRFAQAYCREERRLAVFIRQLQVGALLNQQIDDVTIVKLNSAAQWRFCFRSVAVRLQKVPLLVIM